MTHERRITSPMSYLYYGLLCLRGIQFPSCEGLCSPGHAVILYFHQPMHGNLVLDSGVKDTETEEEPAGKEKEAGNKDEHEISR